MDKVQLGNEIRTRLSATRRLAWLALAWERLWPLVLPALAVLSLFLTVSWLGLWPTLSDGLRTGLLIAFAIGFIAALYPLRHFRLPEAGQLDTRIERTTGLPHRPVTAQSDSKARTSSSDDAFAAALWSEHQRRAASKLNGLRAGVAMPAVAARDPWALRSLIALSLFVSVMAGWGQLGSRIGDAFRSHNVAALIERGRIDAWVKPPAYTNRPPIFISRAGFDDTRPLSVPEGSEVVIRALDQDTLSIGLIQSGLERAIEPDADEASGKTTTRSYTFELKTDSSVVLRLGEDVAKEWVFAVLPDEDPAIDFVDQPAASTRGALEFSFSVSDDYGVVSAEAQITSAGQLDTDAVPLVAAPELPLPLPRRRAKEGTTKVSRDLTNHPWAGAEVVMTLSAADDADQKGYSDPVRFTLPERIFTQPLAKAIVFERRRLALDLRQRADVAEMLDVITSTHPETFIPNKSIYTSLRVAYRIIDRSRVRDRDALREAVDLLWDIALAVEDGDLSQAERRLRDAQERLSDALENDAPDEEIAQLMEELRQAMDEFMRELAERMARNQQNQQAMPLDQNTQVLRQQDLERMMQRIEDLAKSGSRDAARELLREMQRMMNNLQTARPGQQQQRNDEFSEQMNKLGEMMRRQQELMDRTFDMQRRQQQQQQQGGQNQRQQRGQMQPGQDGQRQRGQQQGQNGEGQRPMTAEEFAEAMRNLQQQQGELQRQMQELQDAMRGMGMEPGKLGEAGEAMGEAENQLGQGDTGEATGEQGRALQAMRDGAQQMMQQMQNMARQQGQGDGQGQQSGGPNGQQRTDRDPLGRQSRTRGPQLGDDTRVPGEIDAQRAREILEAIRRRLSEPARPRLELDYLDRLLPSR